MTQETQEVEPCVNLIVSTMASRLKYFKMMNPPIFFGSKINEDTQDFEDEVYEIVHAMGVTFNEKAERVVYQLKDMVQSSYTQ